MRTAPSAGGSGTSTVGPSAVGVYSLAGNNRAPIAQSSANRRWRTTRPHAPVARVHRPNSTLHVRFRHIVPGTPFLQAVRIGRFSSRPILLEVARTLC